jgi:hypothetical protein
MSWVGLCACIIYVYGATAKPVGLCCKLGLMKIKFLSLIASATFWMACTQTQEQGKLDAAVTATAIRPPLPQANVPYSEYPVNAAKGDTLFHHTGSIIVLPPNAFVDAKGQVVNGTVTLRYREFDGPVNFYLSGIPILCDSAGKQYVFESFGMNEILAYREGQPLSVNPASKPSIYMATQNGTSAHQLYFWIA